MLIRSRMKRIGEILVERGWVDAAVIDRALAKQREIPRRLCSLLIAGGVLELDDASRALGEQWGVAAVLKKHLDGRDRSLAPLIPSELARSMYVLPIGRLGNGSLIICARDPQPSVITALSAVITEPIVLAVAPASTIEAQIAETYGNPEEDWDVDLNTGPIASLDLDPLPDDDDPLGALSGTLTLVELDDDGVTRDPTQSGMIQVGPQVTAALPPPRTPPTLPPSNVPRSSPAIEPPAVIVAAPPPIDEAPAVIVDAPPPPPPPEPRPPTRPPPIEAGTISAVEAAAPAAKPLPSILDRTAPKPRVDPDVLAAAYAVAPPKFDPSQIAVGTEPPRRRPITLPASLAETKTLLSSALTRDAATSAAMKFAAGRWRATLLLAVKERSALGEAGSGNLLPEDVVASLAIPLDKPSIVALALEANRLTTALPDDASPVQDRLDRLLGMPRFPTAMPVRIRERAEFLLVIGDPIISDTDAATADLEQLADALGAAYTRLIP